jgi:putative ABC transport system ATP-binding protein
MMTVLLEEVSKRYGDGPQAVAALTDVTLSIRTGEFLAIMGPSGSGKSTLLNLIAGVDTATRGRVVVVGKDLGELTDDARSDLRLRSIGIVFQSFNLLPALSAYENVTLPLEFLGIGWRAARQHAGAILERVGLQGDVQDRRPAELSGGEQQRVAIARALVATPALLLADEPTGNLDSTTGTAILELLHDLNRERQLTVVLVTHGEVAAQSADRIVTLRDGRIAHATDGKIDGRR